MNNNIKISDVCSTQCFGIDGYDGSCCSIEDRDWIIGPIGDSHEFIEKLSSKLGRKISWDDVFIKWEEGKDLFPNKPAWQDRNNYPAFRIDLDNPKRSCIFYNTTVKSCMVYDIRPHTCRTYQCAHLRRKMLNISNK